MGSLTIQCNVYAYACSTAPLALTVSHPWVGILIFPSPSSPPFPLLPPLHDHYM